MGYTTKDPGEVIYPYFGACFVPVDGSDTYKLNDLKPIGMDPEDYIQVINGNDLTDVTGMYGYLSADVAQDPSEVGWYDVANGEIGDPDWKIDDKVTMKVGLSFLGYIGSGSYPKFQSSGEAPTVTRSVSSDGVLYPYIANFIPRDIPLNWVIPSGITPEDYIQIINGNDLTDVTGMYGYLSADVAQDPSEVGWYDVANGEIGDPDWKLDDSVILKAGDGFLGYIGSGETVDFQFPSSIKTVE